MRNRLIDTAWRCPRPLHFPSAAPWHPL